MESEFSDGRKAINLYTNIECIGLLCRFDFGGLLPWKLYIATSLAVISWEEK
jgi:hypothetical protein